MVEDDFATLPAPTIHDFCGHSVVMDTDVVALFQVETGSAEGLLAVLKELGNG